MRGQGLISCEGCIRTEESNLGWYVSNSVEPLIESVEVVQGMKL